jgi:uncharacterized protein
VELERTAFSLLISWKHRLNRKFLLVRGARLISRGDPQLQNELFYWHREAKSSNAEVDYLIDIGTRIVPVEVKSSTKGSMASMYQFLKEKKSNLGVRISTENFARHEAFLIVPVYAVQQIDDIVNVA